MSVSQDDIVKNNQNALNQGGQTGTVDAQNNLINQVGQIAQSNIGLSVGGTQVGMETISGALNAFNDAGGLSNIGGVLESLSPQNALASIKSGATGLVNSALNIAGLGNFTTQTVSTTFDSDGIPTTTTTNSSGSLSSIILTITGLGLRSANLNGFSDIVNLVPDASGIVSASSVLAGGDLNIKSILETDVGIDFSGTIGSTFEAGIDVLTGNMPKTSISPSAVLGAISNAPTSVLDLVPAIDTTVSNVTNKVKETQRIVNQSINNIVSGVGALQQSADQVNDETGEEPVQENELLTIPSSDPDVVNSDAGTITRNLDINKAEALEVFGPAYDIDNNDITSFEYISSVEELRSEIVGRVSSQITTCVVHWTDSYLDQDIGSQEIDTYQKQLGHEGIQYHYVIRRNGVVQRGRSPLRLSTHTNTLHDQVSIAIAFVGGYNCPTGTKNPDRYRNVRSLTRAQFNSFEEICRTLYFKHPGMQIVGHNDIDINQPDPGFDVIEYCKNIFGKETIFDGSVLANDVPNEKRPI